jgi:hypothetical protein
MKGVKIMEQPTQEQVNEARKLAECAYTKYHLLKDAYLKAESEYHNKLKTFKKLDYQLAEIDGRLKKIPSNASTKQNPVNPELTLQQLYSIAEKLGISISEDMIEDNS